MRLETEQGTSSAYGAPPRASDGGAGGGYYIDSKAMPATAKTSLEPSATAREHAAGPSAAPFGTTAAGTAASVPAHAPQGDNTAYGTQANNGARKAAPAAYSPLAAAVTTPGVSGDAQQYTKEAERIVEEERAASEKLPVYPGLTEQYQLICKMGDGAFSNVYKARHRKSGQKVAIKVVRKYELNSNQVRPSLGARLEEIVLQIHLRVAASVRACAVSSYFASRDGRTLSRVTRESVLFHVSCCTFLLPILTTWSTCRPPDAFQCARLIAIFLASMLTLLSPYTLSCPLHRCRLKFCSSFPPPFCPATFSLASTSLGLVGRRTPGPTVQEEESRYRGQ